MALNWLLVRIVAISPWQGLATSPGDWPLVLRTDPLSMWRTADPHDCLVAQRAGHLVGGVPGDLIWPLVQVAGLQATRLPLVFHIRW